VHFFERSSALGRNALERTRAALLMSTAALADDDDVDVLARTRGATPSIEPRTFGEPAIDDEHRDFFADGDEGRYEGGPASVESRARELAALVDEIDRGGQRMARALDAKTRRAPRIIVGTVIGGCIALLLLAMFLKQRGAVEDTPHVTAVAAGAQLAPRAVLSVPVIAPIPNELQHFEPQPGATQTVTAVAQTKVSKARPAVGITSSAAALMSSPAARRIRQPRLAAEQQAPPASPSTRLAPPTASFPIE